MYPPAGSKDAQGHDLQVGTNCLGPYLLYQLLSPLLIKTAASSPTASVRVVWAASIALHVALPHPEGIVIDKDGRPTDQGVDGNYSQTKAGNVFMAREFAKATPQTGVVHAAFNPGNLQTELQRHWTGFSHWVTVSLPVPRCVTCSNTCRRRLSWSVRQFTALTRSSGRLLPPS